LKRWTRWLRIAAHVAGWLPLALLVLAYAGGTFIDPIRTITLRTGRYAILFLTLSLACTPVEIVTGFRAIVAVRKPLGLYAALYAGLHFAVFAAWDYGLQLDLIWYEVRDRRFIQVGLLALLFLIPLAVTSTRDWMRRLGKKWKHLHRLAYGAGLLAALHYLLTVKADRRLPWTYASIVFALLLVRVPVIQRAIRRLRSQRNPKPQE
jgi:sulfoxide reductase heme-binding subunit YedZ